MIARLAAMLAGLALAAPAAAPAQDAPFGPIPSPAPQQQTQAPSSDDDDNSDEGLSNTQLLLIAGGGFVLLFGIAVAIVRDARSAAPSDRHGPVTAEGERLKATRTPPKRRVQKGRQRAKAARRARRRNR